MRSTYRPSTQRAGLTALAGALVVVASVVTLTSAPSLPVVLPMLAAIGGLVVFGRLLWFRASGVPLFEIGLVYAAIVTLYAVYPLLGFVLNGMQYSPYNDDRLFRARPTVDQISIIGWFYVVHLCAFMGAYVVFRGRLPRAGPTPGRPATRTLQSALIVYVVIASFLLLLDVAFDISAASYMGRYVALSQLPPGIAQLASLAEGVRLTVEIVILYSLFWRYRRYRLVIAGWLAWVALGTLVRLGNRTELMLLLLATVALYHYMVRPLSLRWIAMGGLSGVAQFTQLEMMRSGWLLPGVIPSYNPFSYAGEFEVLFGNAFDLYQRQLSGELGDVPVSVHLYDLIAGVPRGLLPFPKISPADWYVQTFFPVYAAEGGGLAFGTVLESILGWGWLDLVLRGGGLGVVLAAIQRYTVLHKPSAWLVIFYIWLVTQLYQSFRTTTFVLFFLFVYRFVWIVVVIRVLALVIRSPGKSSYALTPS